MEDTDSLDPFQLGFRPCYSTDSALVTLHNDLLREVDQETVTLLAFLDFSATFDTVNCNNLLDGPSNLEIRNLALHWLQDFLDCHIQMVHFGDTVSTPKVLCYGIPQGLIVSPMLFLKLHEASR